MKEKKLLLMEDELLNLLKNQKCVLFGAGEYAKNILAYSINNGVDIDRLLVTNVKDNTSTIWGATVLHINEYLHKLSDTTMIVCVKELSQDEIKNILEHIDIGEVVYISDQLYRDVKGKFKNPVLKKRNEMQLLILNILDHCNLKCVGCDHFACIADEYLVPYQILEKEIKRMNELMGNEGIREISIMGGETLLHPDLPKIIQMVRLYFPKAMIRVTTNGLFLLKQKDEFWNSCRNNQATIIVTRYPINLDFATIKEKVVKEGVDFQFFEGTSDDVEKCFSKHIIELDGQEDFKERFSTCGIANYGNFLMDGKIYGCPFACQAIRIFNKKYNENLVLSDDDYLNIYDAKSADEILEFAATPKKFCRFCGGLVGGVEWKRSKMEKSEWVNE